MIKKAIPEHGHGEVRRQQIRVIKNKSILRLGPNMGNIYKSIKRSGPQSKLGDHLPYTNGH